MLCIKTSKKTYKTKVCKGNRIYENDEKHHLNSQQTLQKPSIIYRRLLTFRLLAYPACP